MTTSQEIILFKPHYLLLVGGFNPSEKYEFVSWDCSSQYMETQKNVPNHQPVYMYIYIYIHTLWLFKIAMENDPFIDAFL